MNNLKYILIIVISTTASLFAANGTHAAQDYYTWIDENGVKNYAQRNPRGYKARRVSKTHKFGEQIFLEKRPAITPSTLAPAEIDSDALLVEQAAAKARTKRPNWASDTKNLARLLAFSRERFNEQGGTNRVLLHGEPTAI
jgi:hypothetical protein